MCKQLFGKWYKFKTLIIQHALTQRSQEALEDAEDRTTKAHRSCFNENQSNRKKGGKQIKKHHTEMPTQHQTLWFLNRRPIRAWTLACFKVLASFTLPAPMVSAKDEPLEQSPSVSTKEILPLRTQKHQWHGTIPCLAKVGEADDSKTSGDA